jgi:hypothetical protein
MSNSYVRTDLWPETIEGRISATEGRTTNGDAKQYQQLPGSGMQPFNRQHTRNEDPMLVYLRNQGPVVIDNESPEHRIIIPPLNTDIRFESELPLFVPSRDQRNRKIPQYDQQNPRL